MALPASDAFTGAGPIALTAYSANWTYNTGTFEVRSNACGPTNSSGDSLARWNADAFGDDQYAQVTVTARTSTEYSGPAVRLSTSGAVTGYGVYWNDTIFQLFKFVAGTWTQIGTDQTAPGVGVVVRLEVEGTTLRVKFDGATVYTQTDSAISTGAAGLCGYGSAGAGLIDAFEADNLGGGAPTITDQPDNASATEGTTAGFTVAATTSGGTLLYQWQVDTGGGWANVSTGSGGTTASYTTGTLALSDDGNLYRCRVTDDNGTTDSSSATLTVNPAITLMGQAML